jgi:glutamine amidotransferase
MCRLFVYQGPPVSMSDLLIRPGHSLLRQSFESNERSYAVNADGFGIGWYNHFISDKPAIFREITPAWSSQNLQEISSLIMSERIFAHVRAASHGIPVNEMNCHPFKHENMLWMHNGRVGSFRKIRRKIEEILSEESYQLIQGSTDSEYAFALFIHFLNQKTTSEPMIADYLHGLVQMIYKIRQLNHGLGENNSLNFAFTDGKITLITRYSDSGENNPPSLYYSSGESYYYLGDKLNINNEGKENFIMIASEPVNSQPEVWIEIPKNTLMVVNENLNYHFINLDDHVRMDNI